MIYNRVFKVPVWVVLDSSLDQNTKENLSEWLDEAEAIKREFHGDKFGKAVRGYRDFGYADSVPADPNTPYHLLPELANLALEAVLKKYYRDNPATKRKRGNVHIDFVVRGEQDYVRIMNDILSDSDDISLSYLLKVGELCHNGDQRSHVFYSSDFPKDLIQRVANRTVFVGKGVGFDVDLSDSEKDPTETLGNFMGKLFGK